MSLFDVSDYVVSWNLEERFIVPPFTVLDARSGRWRTRRARWDTLDLDSGNGRPDELAFKFPQTEFGRYLASRGPGSSIFDPVLCELMVRWWSPPDGVILDPFAGGSVRGLVSSLLGREYHGVDLSPLQVEANEKKAADFSVELEPPPRWYVASSADWVPDVRADYIMSCPPYGNLEKYTDDPADLSTMSFGDFCSTYARAISRACHQLKQDRFAAFVVGNYRDAISGVTRDLVGATCDAFCGAGLDFLADVILIQPPNTAGVRASTQFNVRRRPTRVHQTLLVFVKGDPKRAAAAAEQIDPGDYSGVALEEPPPDEGEGAP